MRELQCFDLKKAAPGSRQKSHHSRPSLHTPRKHIIASRGKERKFASNNVDILSVGQRNPLKLLRPFMFMRNHVLPSQRACPSVPVLHDYLREEPSDQANLDNGCIYLAASVCW